MSPPPLSFCSSSASARCFAPSWRSCSWIAAAARHGQQAGSLLAEAALLLGQLGHPLERFGEAGSRSGALHVSAGAEELVRRGVERVHRPAGLLRAFPRVG